MLCYWNEAYPKVNRTDNVSIVPIQYVLTNYQSVLPTTPGPGILLSKARVIFRVILKEQTASC